MSPRNMIKRAIIFSLVILGLHISSALVFGQQTAPAANSTGNGDTNPPTSKSNDAVKSGQTSSKPGLNIPYEDPNVPNLPGATVQVLKDGQKPPEREDEDYEDWSVPTIKAGMRIQAMPLLETKGDGFSRQLVEAQWRELDPIDLWIIRPEGIKNPPVILYMYSYPSTNAIYKNDEACKFLVQNGFAAVGLVPALTEHRFHDRPTKEWFVSQMQEALSTSTHDVQMALNYLASTNEFDMTRVGMWGDGAGASVAIMAAAVDQRIKVLDLLNPWGDWPDWLAKSTLIPEAERADYLKPDFLSRLDQLDPVKWLPTLQTQTVRLQLIGTVTVTPPEVRKREQAVVPVSATTVYYADTKTFYGQVASKGLGFNWIKEQLGKLPPGPIPVQAPEQTK